MQRHRGESNLGELLPRETLELYGFAVLAIAGADGELSKAERDLLLCDGKLRGVSEAVLGAWERFDWQSAQRRPLLSRIRPLLSHSTARMLVFDAIRVSRADGGYALEERNAVDEAAELLGVEQSIVDALQGLAEMQEGMRRLERGLLEVA